MNIESLSNMKALRMEIDHIKANGLVDNSNYNETLNMYEEQIFELEKQIFEIDDPTIRLIIRQKFIKGLTWSEISYRLGYAYESGARNKLRRFLDKNS